MLGQRKITILLMGVICLAFIPKTADAGNFRFRAREHFEWLSIRYGPANASENYFGLTNTLNAWYEEPHHFGIGLAFGPLLGSAEARNGAPPGTDSKVRLWNIGIEGKYFFFPGRYGLFGRAGLTGNLLDTRGTLGILAGGGYYLGLGWEHRFWKIGVAPEVAFRHVLLEKNSRVLSFTPSVGLHFYVLPNE